MVCIKFLLVVIIELNFYYRLLASSLISLFQKIKTFYSELLRKHFISQECSINNFLLIGSDLQQMED